MEGNRTRQTVFFDLDGTLHRQDLFGSFILYHLRRSPLNLLLVIILIPLILVGFLLYGKSARWPVSLLVWGATFGNSEARLSARRYAFSRWFHQHVEHFPAVQAQLESYLQNSQADVWLITGSPESLVNMVYGDSKWLPRVNIIGSQLTRYCGGWILTLRCVGNEKVYQLEQRIGSPLSLYSGYSDSDQDNPLLAFCQHRWRVTRRGELRKLS